MIYKNRSVASSVKTFILTGFRCQGTVAAFVSLLLGLMSTLYSNKALDHIISVTM